MDGDGDRRGACHDGLVNYLQIVLPVLALLAVALMNFAVMPALRRHRAEEAVTAEWERGKERKPEVRAAPEPREPRDKDRTYPRPKGSRSKLNRVCPVCGTGQETTALDGRVLGWPAHQTCAEWLGDWHPRRTPTPPYKPDPELIGYMEGGQKGNRSVSVSGNLAGIASTGTGTVNVTYTGGTAITMPSGGTGFTSSQVETCALLATGLITVDEARLRLNAEILGAFGVPPPVIGWPHSCTEQRLKPQGAPVIHHDCCCGHRFTGTEAWVAREIDDHCVSGRCPAFRGTDPGPIEIG